MPAPNLDAFSVKSCALMRLLDDRASDNSLMSVNISRVMQSLPVILLPRMQFSLVGRCKATRAEKVTRAVSREKSVAITCYWTSRAIMLQ